MTSINTETETVIKKILPYLQRRGYDLVLDLDFETSPSLRFNQVCITKIFIYQCIREKSCAP